MPVPVPTPVLRFIHVGNLHICLERRGLYAPHSPPDDGLIWRTNHNIEIQAQRRVQPIHCGPGGVVHDYVPFYFGYRSPMMFQLHTGRVPGYNETQAPLIYLVSNAQAVQESGTRFVFSDGHGIAAYTGWFDDLADLDKVDWAMVYERYWADSVDDMDRQRRKQAEFLVHDFCDWSLIERIAVVDQGMKDQVEEVLTGFPEESRRPVDVERGWYYD